MPAASGDSAVWPKRDGGDGVVVWLERTGPAHANDAMVLERLAHSVLVSSAGTAGDGVARQSLEVLLDPGSARTDRERAAARLGLEPRTLLTVVATGGASAPGTPGAASTPSTAGAVLASARMATAYGLVTASLVRGDPAATGVPTARCGVGTPVTVDHLSRSWSEALLALRVTTDREPWVRIEDLGLLAQAVEAADHASSPPADVAGVERAVAHGWSLEALASLADAESVRAVARAAGLHHSTLQARLADLPRHLGFDAATGRGRARLHTALIVRRAANARFG